MATTSQPPERRGQTGEDAYRTPIERAQHFILDNFKSEISLERLALEANLSKYHFARRFKAATGFTSMHYLSLVRLSEAAKLLASTGMQVSEVCYEVGFGDLTHFERRFKKENGCTPTAFRKLFGRAAVMTRR